MSHPKNPTHGWMRSELEKIGFSNRGTAYTDAELAALLNDRGYDIRIGRKETKQYAREKDRDATGGLPLFDESTDQ